MTPQEKAQELFDKMNGAQDEFGNYPMCFDTAKQCAMIAVDEIYKTNLKHGAYIETDWDKTYYYSYWEDVKQEIEKL